MKKVKILYLIDTLEVGGAEKSILEIVQNFERHEGVICHIYRGETLKNDYEAAGIKVISLNIGGKFSFGKALKAVQNVIEREKPDIIHTTLFRSNIIGRVIGWVTRTPVISSFVSDPYCPARRDKLSKAQTLKVNTLQLLDAVTCKLATCFVSNSESVKISNCHYLNVPPSKVRVIYRGRDSKRYSRTGKIMHESLCRILNVPASAVLILNSGRLREVKGQIDLIRAMPDVLRNSAGVVLLIAGEGDYRTALEREIQRLDLRGNVFLLGHRDDIPDLLSAIDIFVFPSHYEGLGGALIEAMFAGKPIVASDISPNRECILAEQTGVLAPANDPGALASAIIKLLENPDYAKYIGANAHEDALRRFEIIGVARQHEDYYDEVFEHWQKDGRNTLRNSHPTA